MTCLITVLKDKCLMSIVVFLFMYVFHLFIFLFFSFFCLFIFLKQ